MRKVWVVVVVVEDEEEEEGEEGEVDDGRKVGEKGVGGEEGEGEERMVVCVMYSSARNPSTGFFLVQR